MNGHESRDVLEEHRRGELPPEQARAVEAHLATCAACRAIQAQEEALVRLIRTLPRSPAPPALSRQIRGLGAPRRGIVGWVGRPWVAAALAAVLVLAIATPWLLRPRVAPPNIVEVLIQSGVNEHRRILLDLEADPREITDPAALFQRVGAITAVELPTVLTGTDELRLVSARPTLLASRKTAAATLRSSTSKDTTYFILQGADLPMPAEGRVQIEQYRPYMREVNGFNVVYWKQKELAYLMVSGLDQEGCQKLYLKIRRAL